MEISKVLSPVQIAAGSFWGGPIATVYYLRKNYLLQGRNDYAQKTLVYGILFIIALLVVLPFIPDAFPGMVIPIAYCLAAKKIALKTQMSKTMIESSEGYTFESNWMIFGVGIVTLVAFLSIIIGYLSVLDLFGIIRLG
ncbi:MAG: hypothetical protein ACTIM4_14110 [Marinomonas sp.]